MIGAQAKRISLSRQSKDVSITPLNSELSSLSMTLTQDAKNAEYDRAKTSWVSMNSMKEEFHQNRLKQEQKRQFTERKNLQKAKEREMVQLQEHWKERVHETDQGCETAVAHLKEQHEIQKHLLEQKLQKMQMPSVKFSPPLLNYLDAEKKLARFHSYDEARDLKTRIANMKKMEIENFKKKFYGGFDKHRKELAKKQEEELAQLYQRNKFLRARVRREQAESIKRYEQSYRNHEQDMKHSHTMEFKTVPETVVSMAISRKHHEDTSGTFRGTLLFERTAGPKYEAPSLCSLHDFSNMIPDHVEVGTLRTPTPHGALS